METLTGFVAQPTGQRARARRLVDQLRAVLERQIDDGRLKPGDRLATERELSAQFGASRNVVRIALGELHKVGKITRHVGRGTIVATDGAPERGVEGLKLDDVSPAELLEFRIAFEPGLAEAITLHASERDLQAVMECVDRGDGAQHWAGWEQWDRAFHQSLVTATHNKLAIAAYGTVGGVRHKAPWLEADAVSIDSERWRRYQIEHRQIAEALLARDAPAAATAIRTHLLRVRAKMLGH